MIEVEHSDSDCTPRSAVGPQIRNFEHSFPRVLENCYTPSSASQDYVHGPVVVVVGSNRGDTRWIARDPSGVRHVRECSVSVISPQQIVTNGGYLLSPCALQIRFPFEGRLRNVEIKIAVVVIIEKRHADGHFWSLEDVG